MCTQIVCKRRRSSAYGRPLNYAKWNKTQSTGSSWAPPDYPEEATVAVDWKWFRMLRQFGITCSWLQVYRFKNCSVPDYTSCLLYHCPPKVVAFATMTRNTLIHRNWIGTRLREFLVLLLHFNVIALSLLLIYSMINPYRYDLRIYFLLTWCTNRKSFIYESGLNKCKHNVKK